MTTSSFTLKYNVTGAERKKLVKAISDITGAAPQYEGAPTFAYQVDYLTIDRNGSVSFDDRADSEEIEHLIDRLGEMGFAAEPGENDAHAQEAQEPQEVQEPETAPGNEAIELCISFPKANFTPETLANLKAMLAAKAR